MEFVHYINYGMVFIAIFVCTVALFNLIIGGDPKYRYITFTLLFSLFAIFGPAYFLFSIVEENITLFKNNQPLECVVSQGFGNGTHYLVQSGEWEFVGSTFLKNESQILINPSECQPFKKGD